MVAQGANPDNITNRMIPLQKKGGMHVWEELEDYRPITLLNTELKILVWILVNCSWIVVGDLIGLSRNMQ